MDEGSPRFEAAIRDFRRARQRGALERVVAQLRGRSSELLHYGEVSEQLRAGEAVDRGLQMIPLDAIVGSVGRYTDFTRSFLPRRKNAQERWARVRATFERLEDIPPIQVYRLGESYFVLDGNHRVSVARVLGASEIPAYVTEIPTKVSLTPDVQPDELITRVKYAEFLEETNLDELRPEADLTVTAPGQYRVLKEQIQRCWLWMRERDGTDVPYERAVVAWYDEVYLPLVTVIRRRGLLRYFPERTETDLYAWIARHREELEEELGWDVDDTSAARDLVDRFSPSPQKVLGRVKERIKNVLTPESLEAGPPIGHWREDVLGAGHEHNLFGNILVALNGEESGWRGLEQALLVAEREGGQVNGLHVEREAGALTPDARQRLEEQFRAQCSAAGVPGELSLEVGPVSDTICERAYWNDLLVIPLSHPPGPRPGDRLSSGFSKLVRRCSRPVLAVPGAVSPLQRPLLAFDGSPKAKEALFVAAYLAGKWRVALTVLTVADENASLADERDAAETLTFARQYLQSRRVDAFYAVERGPAPEVLRRTAEERDSDMVIMGGFGFRPLLDVMLGSTVNDVLRWRRWPVLICR
ncbi:MAG: universal stress protein [Chloroflexota bacterium]